jgi:hypothetical protein
VLEQRGPDDPDVGSGHDRAVDVASDPPARDAEAVLAAVTCPGAQVKPGRLQPANGQVLELVSGVEDAEQPAGELFAVVHRRERDLVGEPADARLADPAAAEIIARRPRPVLRLERCVDQRVDPDAGIAHGRRRAVDETRARVQVDQHHPKAFHLKG